jgi:23S rRNA (cytidine2498-2'-O)-methyltransferase
MRRSVTALGLLLSAAPDFGKLALAELTRIAPSAGARLLSPGLWGIQGVSFAEVARAFREAPPVFVRHIAPVDMEHAVPATSLEREALLARLAEPLASARLTGTFSVQLRAPSGCESWLPFELRTALVAAIRALTQLELEVRAPRHVVSVLVHEGRLYAGVSEAGDNLSSWAGGAQRFAREPEQLSRAEFKLLEALDSFALPLVADGRALDLGAAPGGWTRVLLARGQHVVAVDPAHLHPSLSKHERVRHLRISAERYLESASGPFDVILNDIRKDAVESAELVARCAPLLAPRGCALLTLKLRHERRTEQIEAALRVLRPIFGICRVRHLFHNRSEVSVYLRRSGEL